MAFGATPYCRMAISWLELVYSDFMGCQEPEQVGDARTETFVDERGVMLTRAGVERAGERLAESRGRHTAEYFASLRDRLGVPPRTA
jgi:hypothetical protein